MNNQLVESRGWLKSSGEGEKIDIYTARNLHQIVMILWKSSKEWKWNRTKERRGCLLLMKLVRRKQMGNNQVCLVYNVCIQSNGYERWCTVEDLDRSPTLDRVAVWLA
jgi:hypothetical protein